MQPEKEKGARRQLVACYGQGFGEEICVIAKARDEHGAEVPLSNPVPDPMSIDFDILRLMLSLSVARPIAIATSLSQKIGVGG